MVPTLGIIPTTTCDLLSVQLSTKCNLRIRNLCAKHDTAAELKHCHTVTCMHVNAIRTILQLTLVTHGHLRVRPGAKKKKKGTYIPIITHNNLIIMVARNRNGYITPAFSGPHCGEKINLERSGCGGNEQKMCEKGWTGVKLGENPKMPHPQCRRSINNCCQTTTMPKVSQSMSFQYGQTPK